MLGGADNANGELSSYITGANIPQALRHTALSVQLSRTYPRLLWIINIWYRSHLTGTPHLVSVPLSLPPPLPCFPEKMRRRPGRNSIFGKNVHCVSCADRN